MVFFKNCTEIISNWFWYFRILKSAIAEHISLTPPKEFLGQTETVFWISKTVKTICKATTSISVTKLFSYELSKISCFHFKFIKGLFEWVNKIFLRETAKIYQSIFLGVVASKDSKKWILIFHKQTKYENVVL